MALMRLGWVETPARDVWDGRTLFRKGKGRFPDQGNVEYQAQTWEWVWHVWGGKASKVTRKSPLSVVSMPEPPQSRPNTIPTALCRSSHLSRKTLWRVFSSGNLSNLTKVSKLLTPAFPASLPFVHTAQYLWVTVTDSELQVTAECGPH